jgi:uncharacterized RDD family membrane protein YckC
MTPILDAPVLTEQKLEYAGFWIRVVAYVIDSIIVTVVFGLLSFALVGGALGVDSFQFLIVLYLVCFVGIFSYFAIMESSARQATLGKMAVGIKVGNAENGGRISTLNAFGRVFSKILSGAILYIGYIMVGFDSKKQGLHDKIANTIVYYG